MRRGFTLIELMVAVAMILIIAGAMHTAVRQAQRRAKVSRAQIEAREITNAILAYQNYEASHSLSSCTMEDAPASESRLGFILGNVSVNGIRVPVLYNAAITRGQILDPWGNPYRITIKPGETIKPMGVPDMDIRLFYPNWHRLSGGER